MNSRKLAELGGAVTRFERDGIMRDGVRFICPSCPDERRHSVVATWSGPSIFPSGAIWHLQGPPIEETLTLTPSINCDVRPDYDPEVWTPEDIEENERTRCKFHGFVTNGQVTW